jgi:hypothetical protein
VGQSRVGRIVRKQFGLSAKVGSQISILRSLPAEYILFFNCLYIYSYVYTLFGLYLPAEYLSWAGLCTKD